MTIKTFEIGDITIDFQPEKVYNSWEHSMEGLLEEDEPLELDGIGGNRQFAPLDALGVDKLRELGIIESQNMHDIEEGHITITELYEREHQAISDGIGEPHMILDLGLRYVVMALLEVGAHPFSSCNAGSFPNDNRHAESYPLVAMYGNNDAISIIKWAAERSGCGLYGTEDPTGMGALVLYSNNIRNFTRMAGQLLHSLD